MIHPVTRAGLAALALTLSGCALTFDATDLGVRTSLAESARTPPQGTSFRITKHPVFLLWGLTAASRPNAEDVLAGQAGTGARIANLRIKVRSRWPRSSIFRAASTDGNFGFFAGWYSSVFQSMA